jgi:Crinkler effector protein N-terminal domain
MAVQQPADYKLFCTVVGKTPFSVKISPDDTVGELKDAIKTKKSHAFHNLDADDLTLYIIDPAIEGSLTEKVEKLLAGQPPPLEPVKKLSAVFLKPPEDGEVHILVQPPRAGEFLCADIRRMTRLTKHPRHPVAPTTLSSKSR